MTEYTLDDLALIARAQHRGRRVHRDDVDKAGQPYVEHIDAVARGTELLGGSAAAIAAAWLHDTVEDHPDQISLTYIEDEFGHEVALLVRAVTHEKDENYYGFVSRVINAGHDAVCIKLADLIHNTRADRMSHLDAATRLRLLDKYSPAMSRLMTARLKGEI